AAEKIAAGVVGYGEWVAVSAVAGPEFAFVVGAPEVIGRGDDRRGRAWMGGLATTAFVLDESVALQDIADGRALRPRPTRMPLVQDVEQLFGAPARMMPAGLEDRLDDMLRRAVRRVLWPSRALQQAGGPVDHVSIDPLIGRLPANVVVLAELGNREGLPQVIGDELGSLVHG